MVTLRGNYFSQCKWSLCCTKYLCKYGTTLRQMASMWERV